MPGRAARPQLLSGRSHSADPPSRRRQQEEDDSSQEPASDFFSSSLSFKPAPEPPPQGRDAAAGAAGSGASGVGEGDDSSTAGPGDAVGGGPTGATHRASPGKRADGIKVFSAKVLSYNSSPRPLWRQRSHRIARVERECVCRGVLSQRGGI